MAAAAAAAATDPLLRPPSQCQQQDAAGADALCFSTLHHQQQHFVFLQSDASQLQHKIIQEVQKFEEHTEALKDFLLNFADEFDDEQQRQHGEFKYRNLLQEIVDQKRDDLPVYLQDVATYFSSSASSKSTVGVYASLLVNTFRYVELIHLAADKVIAEENIIIPSTETEGDTAIETLLDQTLATDEGIRKAHEAAKRHDPWRRIRARDMATRGVPAHLRHSFRISLIPPSAEGARPFRSVDAFSMGKFSFFCCQVLKVETAKPRLVVAAFECEACHDKVFQPVEDEAFMPLSSCPSCRLNHNRDSPLHLHPKLSLFLPSQIVKVQEPTNQVPEADAPRTLTCRLLGHAFVNKLQPGMHVTLGGVLLPVRPAGSFAFRGGLLQQKVFLIKYISLERQLTADERRQETAVSSAVERLRSHVGLYELLARSVAPGVYGLMDVKKALLLQLIGGCSREKGDGGKIRGDIHVLLMGDPGLAKSQLLKQIAAAAARGVYTTGKGSSSSGLTAAVVKDPNTGETTLEGGALVLADKGICCIDEFDKMEDFDRSAIYEAMEQQSVSVAKAGHCTSLPARAAVLAAANPKDGRYDERKSMMANINLAAALLSRFDLQFLLLDRADLSSDAQMASHVLHIFQSAAGPQGGPPGGLSRGGAPGASRRGRSGRGRRQQQQQQRQEEEVVDKNVLRAFIERAKRIKPVLSDSLIPQISDWYSSTRFDEQQQEKLLGSLPSYTTPRALLGVIRLAQALARLRESPLIETADFEEALRLLEASKASIRTAEETAKKRRQDKVSQVFEILKRTRYRLMETHGASWDGFASVSSLERQAAAVGISPQQLMAALEQYEEMLIVSFDRDRQKVAFVAEARGEPEEMDGEQEEPEGQ